jgi:caspase domain-containing protein
LPVEALVKSDGAVAGAGVHALIVGVSDYLHLPPMDVPPSADTWFLSKLTSAALSAYRVYQWLAANQLRLPLKSVRLLLSPSQRELEAEPALRTLTVPDAQQTTVPRASRATFEGAVRAWRRDAAQNPDDMALFYFAGHGLQRVVDEGVLLFDDFLEADHPPLSKCALVGNLRAGLTPSVSIPKVANTQFFFLDCCLLQPEALARFANPQVPDIFGIEATGPVDRRESVVLFSTLNRAMSIGRDGQPSHFAGSLLSAFEQAAEEPVEIDGLGTVWPVTAQTIKTAVNLYYDRNKLGTKVKMDNYIGEPIIRYLGAPPDVKLSILIQPGQLDCSSTLLDDSNNNALPASAPFVTTEFDVTIKAGGYKMEIGSARLKTSPYKSALRWINQKSSPWRHNLGAALRP